MKKLLIIAIMLISFLPNVDGQALTEFDGKNLSIRV